MGVINIKDKFDSFNEHWTPKIVGELNGQFVKLANLRMNSYGTATNMRMNFSWCLRGL